VTTEKYIIIKT